MKLNYINKIRANISIYSSKKTSNILDGTYKSIYKGKSFNFENLREYVINDDIKDIDWKSSARSGKLLIKQFLAEKKHNIMLVMDTGIKMSAETDSNVSKKDIALYTAGTIGYLAIKNSDYVGMLYSNNDKIIYKPLKYNLYNLEEYLCSYDKSCINNGLDLNNILKHIYKNFTKKMIIFIITDIKGIDNINYKILKELSQIHDILCVNINDKLLFGENIYDLDEQNYIPDIISNDPNLNKLEKEIKQKLLKESSKKLKKIKINLTSISSLDQINNKIIELLEEHKYASHN